MTSQERIAAIAADALIKAGGDWEEAERVALKHLLEHPKERDLIADDLIRLALREQIQYQARATRKEHWSTPSKARQDTVDGLALTAEDTKQRLMEYVLRGGRQLGEATKAEIEAEASWFLHYGRSNLVRGYWFDAIAKALKKPDHKVKDHLTEQRLKSLQKIAREKIA